MPKEELSPDLEEYRDFIEDRQAEYDQAMDSIIEALGFESTGSVNRSDLVSVFTQQKFLNGLQNVGDKKLVIGVAGPGAVGKGTLMGHLKEAGYSTVVNTTTRPARVNNGVAETDGVEYFFRDEQEYKQEAADGKYLTMTSRPGRGEYAVSKEALSKAVYGSKDGTLVEENPETLAQLLNAIGEQESGMHGVILYVLPPGKNSGREIIEVVERLKKRSGDNFSQADLESTCGGRQMQELASLIKLIKAGTEIVFIENDDLEQSKSRLTKLFVR